MGLSASSMGLSASSMGLSASSMGLSASSMGLSAGGTGPLADHREPGSRLRSRLFGGATRTGGPFGLHRGQTLSPRCGAE
jgi:hypothetical protein